MRELTLFRRKRLIGSRITMQIYMEDAEGDVFLQKTRCRLLGSIKNGEKLTLSVPERECRIFVTPRSGEYTFSTEVYLLPEGTEPVFLSGQSYYSFYNGSFFRFDHNDEKEALALRKKNKKVGMVTTAVALFLGIMIGFFFTVFAEPEPKDFQVGDVKITLTDAFSEATSEGFDAVLQSDEMLVFFLSDSKQSLPEGVTELDDYRLYVLENNGRAENELKSRDGIPYFTFVFAPVGSEINYTYYVFFFEHGDLFYQLFFAIDRKLPEEEKQVRTEQIFTYVKSVSFS